MRLVKTIFLAALAGSSLTAFAQNGPPISVVVDGNPIVFPDMQPTESNDRVLVPLRGVFEHLGATVDWDPATQSITARKRSLRVKLAIGQLDASVDGQPVHMDVPATLVGGTTMVPLRFVSEALGAHVFWKPDVHEVDIESTTDYDMPRHPHHDRQVAPPPPPPPVQQPPAPRGPDFSMIPADTILPLSLSTRLSSRVAQPGDQVVASIATDNSRWYLGLPAGTQAYGSVVYSRPQQGPNPGVLEVNFDHLVLPNGKNLPLNGQVADLDDSHVAHMNNGALIARVHARNDRVVFAGYGSGPAMVFGLPNGRRVRDGDIGPMVSMTFGGRGPRPHDVELRPGTVIGFRLYRDLMIPRRR